MTPEDAIQLVTERFPFSGYMTPGTGPKGAYLNIANTVLRYLSPGSKLLDFGCGPCDKASVLQLLGFQCSGYDDLQDEWHKLSDNRAKILRFASDSGIDLRVANGGVLPFEKESFDMVMLHDVLEHLHNSPRDLLNDLLDLVKPGGLLFVTVPNAVNARKRCDVLLGRTNLPRFEGYYWYPGEWRGHIREYVKDDLISLAGYLNLDVLELRGCDHMLENVPAAARPAYLFVTGILPAWKDSWLLVARKGQGWVTRRTLPQDELSRILGKSTSYKYSE